MSEEGKALVRLWDIDEGVEVSYAYVPEHLLETLRSKALDRDTSIEVVKPEHLESEADIDKYLGYTGEYE
jgi:hypothetical protein